MKKYIEAKNSILEQLILLSGLTNHQGMIGTVNVDSSKPEYIYGEITGYFLSFCSYVCKREPDLKETLTPIISSHISWLERIIKCGYVTRCLLEPCEDWRNSAIFPFDIAMIIRGLDDASTIVECDKLLQLYLELFGGFFDYNSETVLPYINISEGKLPQKWSTRIDVHFVKIAADTIPVLHKKGNDREAEIMIKMIKRFDNYGVDRLMDIDSHPLLYYLEGLALASDFTFLYKNFPANNFEKIHYVFKKLLVISDDVGLLDNPKRGSYRRSDVLAQFVRIGLLLRMKNMLSDEELLSLKNILDDILERFYMDGNVLFFDKERGNNNINAWCAMFLYQAIDFYLDLSKGTMDLKERSWKKIY